MARWAHVNVGIAALAGGAGVIEAALVAHAVPDPLLATASNFLILNAAAVIAVSAFAQVSRRRGFLLLAATVLLLGAVLFSGELTAHVFLTHKRFAFIAPIGGSLTILGWLMAAAAALWAAPGARD